MHKTPPQTLNLIEGIAFQTNILALNASVESARAGEAGRGFAVVAAEVRNLALRSSSAAGEIKELLQAAVNRIGTGVNQAEKAGETMASIVTAVERVSQTITEIASSSTEQTEGLAPNCHQMQILLPNPKLPHPPAVTNTKTAGNPRHQIKKVHDPP